MGVNILSIFSNRPDFLPLQLASLKKHLTDEFRYIAVNNAFYDYDKPGEIERIAQGESVGHFRVKHVGKKPEISKLMRDTFNFLWKNFKDTKGILVIMDSDLFLTQDISFAALLDGYDMAYCPTYTQGHEWPWTGFMIFNMDTIAKEDVNFEFESFDKKVYQDVGSKMNGYLQKHAPKVRHIDRRSILDDDWVVAPNETLYTLGFPSPYSVDVLSVEQYPFMFHYKTSSNYAPHCTKEYNEQKTRALTKLLS